MNQKRRKSINQIIERVNEVMCHDGTKEDIERISSDIDSILCEEQDCFDNMPENLQLSFHGMEMEDAIGNLENAMSILEDIITAWDDGSSKKMDTLADVIDYLTDAAM